MVKLRTKLIQILLILEFAISLTGCVTSPYHPASPGEDMIGVIVEGVVCYSFGLAAIADILGII